jgi:actin-related protein 5
VHNHTTPSKFTTQFMARETCYFSADYDAELKSLEVPENMAKMTKVIQFPYAAPVSRCGAIPPIPLADTEQDAVEKTEEEIAAALERRREQGKRLQEISARQRAEKVSDHYSLKFAPRLIC